MTAHRILAEIFEAPDCAGEPDAYDAWCAEADAAELAGRVLASITRPHRIDLAAHLDVLGMPGHAALVLSCALAAVDSAA